MDMKSCSYVVALARTKNYSRCARELYITPQGLSSAIKRLEQSMGVPLFCAAQDGVSLTEYGQVFYEFALKVLEERDKMADEIDALRRRNTGEIRLAVSTGLFNIIPRDLTERFATHTKLGSKLSTVKSVVDNECASGLRNGAWDFALLNAPIDLTSFAAVPLHKDYMHLWAPADSRFAEASSVTLDDLRGCSIVCLTPDEYVTSATYVDRLKGELECNVTTTDEMISVLELALSQGILGIVPRVHAEAFSLADRVSIPITDIPWGVSLCWRRNRNLSPQDEEFIQFMRRFEKFYF